MTYFTPTGFKQRNSNNAPATDADMTPTEEWVYHYGFYSGFASSLDLVLPMLKQLGVGLEKVGDARTAFVGLIEKKLLQLKTAAEQELAQLKEKV